MSGMLSACTEGDRLPAAGEVLAMDFVMNWGRQWTAWWSWARWGLASHSEDGDGGSSTCVPSGECSADEVPDA